MKIYAQFFVERNNTWCTKSHSLVSCDSYLIEPCGDRSVIALDGRMSAKNRDSIARDVCIERGYAAWQILRGKSLADATSASSINRV